jgi:hypothetical protein
LIECSVCIVSRMWSPLCKSPLYVANLNVVASRGGDGRLGGSRWIGVIRVSSSGQFVVVSWVVTLNFVVAGHCP